MTDLITQWGALEPERCRVYESLEGLPHVDFIEIDWLNMELGAHDDLVMVTQYAVQKAIEARWWDLSMERGAREMLYEASIDNRNGGVFHSDHYESYAHALLSAYLKTLEAQP